MNTLVGRNTLQEHMEYEEKHNFNRDSLIMLATSNDLKITDTFSKEY